jgi:probable O-glycosylation ligase (exosortase A-associated)
MVVLALMVVTVVMTFSRGGFLGLVVLAGFMVKNSKNKVASFGLVAAAGVLIWLLAPAAWFERLNTIESADNDGSFMGRVVAWKISWLIAMDHPLFGGGMHAVQRLLVWDTYKPLLPQLDFIPTPPADSSPHAAHSSYFEILGDLGFVGFTLFVSTLLAAFWNCHQIYKMSRARAELAWAAELSRMMQISMVVYVLTTAALSMGYFELLYIMVGLLSRCRRTVRQTVEAGASALTASGTTADDLRRFAHPA